MPVSVVVGGQFGSEGKGKVAHYLAKEMGALAAVRVGGSNSGHTVYDPNGRKFIFRHLPTSAILPKIACVLGPGSYIDIDVLFSEIDLAKLTSDRIFIDPHAVVITPEDHQTEHRNLLRERLGSTESGTGAAVMRRIARDGSAILAGDVDRLSPFVKPTNLFLRTLLNRGERIILEGTQGFGLSVFHSLDYPKATSRDTTAAAFVSEAGLSPLDVDDVVLVIRAFPIRVAGNSGSLPNEIDWETVTRESGSPEQIEEFTSVSRLVRRVGRFGSEVVVKAIAVNQPSRIVLNHLDYVDWCPGGISPISTRMEFFLLNTEKSIDHLIDLIGTSPNTLLSREFPRADQIQTQDEARQ